MRGERVCIAHAQKNFDAIATPPCTANAKAAWERV